MSPSWPVADYTNKPSFSVTLQSQNLVFFFFFLYNNYSLFFFVLIIIQIVIGGCHLFGFELLGICDELHCGGLGQSRANQLPC